MFKITNNTIHCSRGDQANLNLKIPYMDNNGYFKYIDDEETPNVYWYDKENKILYDAAYNKSTVPLSDLTQSFYLFTDGDKITFKVYSKNGYDAMPMLEKNVLPAEDTDKIIIELTEEDTTFGEIANKPITYWYDITLNDDNTVVCYNENGPKEFIQYPAKGDEE